MTAAALAAWRLARPAAAVLLTTGARAVLDGLRPVLDQDLGPRATELLDRGLAALAWLAGALLVIRALDVLVWQRRTPHLPRLLTDLIAALVWVAAGLAIAGMVLGLPLAGILTTSGVAVAILGFALRDMLASLFSGIALSVERPYRIGDWLDIGPPGTVGRVVEVGWLTTRLVTQDGIGLVVPNAQLATRGFSNFDQPGGGAWRDQVTITLGYEVPPARAERILVAAAAEVPGAHARGKTADARIVSCGENGVVWQLRYWVRGYAERVEVQHQVHSAVLRHLYKAGLGPAHRRLDLFHAPMPARTLEHRTQLDVLLARTDLFGTLGQDELRLLARAARRCRVHPGAAVVRQGEPGSSLFVVVEGVLDVEIDFGQGAPQWARLLVPGDMFGEYSLLTGDPRSATVTARTESLLFEITKAGLEPVLERCPELAEAMSRTLMARQAIRPQLEARHAAAAAIPPAGAEQGLLQRIRAFFGLPHERA
jgi:small-conductance mechanosensitive channel/CRP-like cAMP-binding protein